MKKALILYRSKSGYAKEYADLFHKHLDSDIEVYRKFKQSYLDYKEIYYLGGLYMGGINGFKKFKIKTQENQTIHVFPVGASPGNQKDLDSIYKSNFTKDEMKRYQIQYLRGGFDINKCNPIDKFLMTLMKWRLKSIKNPTDEQKQLLKSYGEPISFVCEQNVLDYLK